MKERSADAARRPPLLVEFIGLPGSGKTTTARLASRILRERGHRCAYRPPLPAPGRWPGHRARFAWFRAAQWPLLAASLRFMHSLGPPDPERFRAIAHILFLAYYHRAQRSSVHDVVVLDQSIAQSTWTAVTAGFPDGRGKRTSPSRARVRALLRACHDAAGAPTAIVDLRLDPELAVTRTLARGRSMGRIDGMDAHRLRALLSGEAQTLRTIAEEAAGSSGHPSITLEGLAPAAGNADAVANFLESLLGTLDVSTRTADASGALP